MAAGIPARLSPREGRKFGLTVGIAFLVLGGIVWWRGHQLVAAGLLSVGGLLILAGLLIPGRLGPVFRLWMGLAHAISKVTTPIFMGIIYFVLIAPIGGVMRLFGRNPMTTHHGSASAWVGRTTGGRSDLERQF